MWDERTDRQSCRCSSFVLLCLYFFYNYKRAKIGTRCFATRLRNNTCLLCFCERYIFFILFCQGRVAFENKEYQKAEAFLLRAQRPDMAAQYYKVLSFVYTLQFVVLSYDDFPPRRRLSQGQTCIASRSAIRFESGQMLWFGFLCLWLLHHHSLWSSLCMLAISSWTAPTCSGNHYLLSWLELSSYHVDSCVYPSNKVTVKESMRRCVNFLNVCLKQVWHLCILLVLLVVVVVVVVVVIVVVVVVVAVVVVVVVVVVSVAVLLLLLPLLLVECQHVARRHSCGEGIPSPQGKATTVSQTVNNSVLILWRSWWWSPWWQNVQSISMCSVYSSLSFQFLYMNAVIHFSKCFVSQTKAKKNEGTL